LDWLDALKGLGILAVVAGHIYPGFGGRTVYLFHMPLFFFIGGVLLKPTADSLQFFRRKCVHLLIPYFSYLCLLYLPSLFYFLRDSSEHTWHSAAKMIAPAIIGGRMLSGTMAVFWFVTCFFFTQQIVNYLVANWKHRHILILMGVFLSLSYGNSLLLPKVWLPLNINVVFGAAPWFYAGYLYRLGRLRLHFGCAALLAILSIVLLNAGYGVAYNMKNGIYGVPILSIVFAISWICVLIAVARFSSRIGLLSVPLKQLGIASMTIMFMHQAIQICLQTKLGVQSDSLRFLAAVTLPCILFRALEMNAYTRILFLGRMESRAFKVQL
jgi:fucose 4-O-acetylase-like acetyltransferase